MTETSEVSFGGDVHRDGEGRTFQRVELNGHWVEYRFRNSAGDQTHVIAFPRTSIISEETISELKRLDDAEAAADQSAP